MVKFKILFYMLALGFPAFAQDIFTVDTNNSSMSISGTSSLHDWESIIELYHGSATSDREFIKNVSLTVTVKSIKSGKSGMDKNTYETLKADEYPIIFFEGSQLQITGTSITGEGQLTVAGTTKTIPVKLKYEPGADDSFQVVGEIKLRMTDYGLEPPVALLGAVKAGDELIINAVLNLKK